MNEAIMQMEATTSELAKLLDVSEKTICQWAKAGVMVKVAHGRYDLGRSLQNWTAYQRCVHEGFDHPLDTWMIRQETLWAEEERADPELYKRRLAELDAELEALPLDAEGGSVTDAYVELVGEELPMRAFEVGRDEEGRITRVIGEAKG